MCTHTSTFYLWLWFNSGLAGSFPPGPGSSLSLPAQKFEALSVPPFHPRRATFTDLVFGSRFPEVKVILPSEVLHTGGQREGGTHMDEILLDIQVQHGGSQFHCNRVSRRENGACLALTFPAVTLSMADPHFQCYLVIRGRQRTPLI